MADLTTLLAKFLGNLSFFSGSVSGVLTTNTTQTATIADTNETTLWTYDLPANALNVNGQALRISAWGTAGATANSKTEKLYFGGSPVSFASLVQNGAPWSFNVVVIRTSATAQLLIGTRSDANGYPFPITPATASETLSGAINIKVTGTNGTAAANDIVFRGAVVELLN